MTEKGLQAKIVKFLKAKNCLAYKFASPSMRGVPDLLVITPTGDVFFIEVKHPNGKGVLSPLQKERINEIRDHGQLVLVTDDYDFACKWVLDFLILTRDHYAKPDLSD